MSRRDYILWLLDYASLFEGNVGAALVDCLDCVSRDREDESLIELRHKNPLFLEVCILAALARRVELGSTNTVRVTVRNK